MKKIIIFIIIIIVLGGVYYLISPLFRNIEIDDPIPVNIITDELLKDESEVSSGFEELSPEKKEEMLKVMEDMKKEEIVEMDENSPSEDTVLTEVLKESSPVMGTSGHPASGTVRIIETQDGLVARYEDFSTINGPNLHIYLSKDLEANEFIDLGPIKGTMGNINYELPESVDISEYKYIMHWCVPFRVLFNYAEVGY